MKVSRQRWLSLLVFNTIICLLRAERKFILKTRIRTNEQECFPLDEYASVIAASLEETKIKPDLLILEPGNGLIMDSGVLLTYYTRRVIS